MDILILLQQDLKINQIHIKIYKINKSSTPKSVLFLSDNINEVNAAIETGMKSYIVIRPGNPPIDDDDDGNDDKINHKIIYSLDEWIYKLDNYT